MRKWYKYYRDPSRSGTTNLSMDGDFDDHAKSMGGYDGDDSYASKEKFFAKYFFGYHWGRLEHYDKFLRKHLNKKDDIISIASGRCANELFLMEDGCRITCSDLEMLPAYGATKALFPGFEFVKLDIMKSPSDRKYDAVIALSLIYLFDDDQMRRFLYNVSGSLKKGGCLILDSAGSPDNTFSRFMHDFFLKYETMFLRNALAVVKGKRDGLVIKHFGYRRTDEEILSLAGEAGFVQMEKEYYAFTTEFRRSAFLNIALEKLPFLEPLFRAMGKSIPYTRMFKLQKVA